MYVIFLFISLMLVKSALRFPYRSLGCSLSAPTIGISQDFLLHWATQGMFGIHHQDDEKLFFYHGLPSYGLPKSLPPFS